MIKNIDCFAFDCFGTIFDMSEIPKQQIVDYVDHVRKLDFSKFDFPENWYKLKPFEDVVPGIKGLQSRGFTCVTLSNGSYDLLRTISENNGIYWDYIVDLCKHKVYKPHLSAYLTIKKDLNIDLDRTVMVTANPTFGDIEAAVYWGMRHIVIRNGYPNSILEILEYLECQ